MEERNDQDILLVKSIQENGSKETFGILYDSYAQRVYNFCLSYLGNEEDARDCTQEVFIKVFRSIRGFRLNSTFYTWLYRIMINSCIDMNRKNKRKEIQEEQVPLSNIKSGEESLVSRLTTKQAIEAFNNALGEMKANARTILILRDVEGRSYEEIAEICSCKTGTVRSRLARARLSMAEKLKDFRDEM